MERFIINFINFIIANGWVTEWREFNVTELLGRLSRENRELIKGGTNLPITDSNWDFERHRIVNQTEEYLKGFNFAQIVRTDLRGNVMAFTEEGKNAVRLGSIEVYFQNIINEANQLNQSRKEAAQIARIQLLLTAQQARTNLWMTVFVGIAAVYYMVEIVLEVTKRRFRMPDVNLIFCLYIFLSGILTGIAILLLAKEVLNRKKNK